MSDSYQQLERFSQELSQIPIALTQKEYEPLLLKLLSEALLDYRLTPRLWFSRPGWESLELRSKQWEERRHLSRWSCPAFSQRKPFHANEQSIYKCKTEPIRQGRHICLPLDHQLMYGVLYVSSSEGTEWTSSEIYFVQQLARRSAEWLFRRSEIVELQEQVQKLELTFEVGISRLANGFAPNAHVDETTIQVLDTIRNVLAMDRTTFMAWNESEGFLQTQWIRGGDFRVRSPLRLKMGEGFAGWALKTGIVYSSEAAQHDPHGVVGSQVIQSIICIPLFSSDHKPLGVINAAMHHQTRSFSEREINVLKSIGQQAALAIENARLHQANRTNIEQLRQADLSKNQLISVISHDFRGPLSGVRAFCDFIRKDPHGSLSEQQVKLLDQMERQLDLQERMVNDLLDMARLERNQLSIEINEADFQKLVQEEVHKSQQEAHERGVQLRLTWDVSMALPLIPMDALRIRQVVWNLLHNALKFTPEGGSIELLVQYHGSVLTVKVTDTGFGIPEGQAEKLFEKYYQVDGPTGQKRKGLGLGLAIAREIIHAHHGTISATSEGVGKGSVFSFTLPVETLLKLHTPPAESNLAA